MKNRIPRKLKKKYRGADFFYQLKRNKDFTYSFATTIKKKQFPLNAITDNYRIFLPLFNHKIN